MEEERARHETGNKLLHVCRGNLIELLSCCSLSGVLIWDHHYVADE